MASKSAVLFKHISEWDALRRCHRIIRDKEFERAVRGQEHPPTPGCDLDPGVLLAPDGYGELGENPIGTGDRFRRDGTPPLCIAAIGRRMQRRLSPG
jgi:hypothetical protein